MKHRIDFIDLIKGFAIFTVVVGHVIEKNVSTPAQSIPAYNFIYAFHMPLFMFIGGYVANFQYAKASFKGGGNYLLKKSRELLLPYLLWPLIFAPFFYGNVDLSEFTPTKLTEQVITNIKSYSGLWFLITFWALSIIGFITMSSGNLFRSKYKKIMSEGITMSILLGVVYILSEIFPYELWRQILAYFIFFFIGVFMARYEILQKLATTKWIYSICWIILLIGASQFVAGENHNITKLITGSVSIPVFYYLARTLTVPTAVKNYLMTIGRYSLAIYIVHYYFLFISSKAPLFSNLSVWWITFISIVFAVIITYICVIFAKLIETIPLLNLLLFGKRA